MYIICKTLLNSLWLLDFYICNFNQAFVNIWGDPFIYLWKYIEGFLIAVVSQAVKLCEIICWLSQLTILILLKPLYIIELNFFFYCYYLNVASCSFAGLWQVKAHRYCYQWRPFHHSGVCFFLQMFLVQCNCSVGYFVCAFVVKFTHQLWACKAQSYPL